jgi:hypothetical protein
MKAREKKGVCSLNNVIFYSYIRLQLLSDREKAILATELAAIDEEKCVIM